MTAPNFSSVLALIFDLDGTLIDSKRDLIRSVNAMLHELGREQLHEDTISGYIGHGAPQLVGRALGNGATEVERERALKFFSRLLRRPQNGFDLRLSRRSASARTSICAPHGHSHQQAGAHQQAHP